MRIVLATAVMLLSSVVKADDDSHAAYWQVERARQEGVRPADRRVVPSSVLAYAAVGRSDVRGIVAAEAARQLGPEWVNTALRIAHVESRFNPGAVGPKTRHGRAQGVMQVMPGTARALGYDPSRLRDARYGAAAGVAHMRACIASGVRTEREMAACHVSGVGGWKRQLARGHERYKRQYVAMVMGVR